MCFDGKHWPKGVGFWAIFLDFYPVVPFQCFRWKSIPHHIFLGLACGPCVFFDWFLGPPLFERWIQIMFPSLSLYIYTHRTHQHHIYIYTYVYIHTCIYICTVPIYIYTYTYMYIHMHSTYIYIQIGLLSGYAHWCVYNSASSLPLQKLDTWTATSLQCMNHQGATYYANSFTHTHTVQIAIHTHSHAYVKINMSSWQAISLAMDQLYRDRHAYMGLPNFGI